MSEIKGPQETTTELLKARIDKLKKDYQEFATPGQDVYVEARELNEQGDITFDIHFLLSKGADISGLLSTAGVSNEGIANFRQVHDRGEGNVTIKKTEAGENSQHKGHRQLKTEVKLVVEKEDGKERNGDPAKYQMNTITALATKQLGIPSQENPQAFKPLVTETGLQDLDPAQLTVIKTAGVSYNSYSSY